LGGAWPNGPPSRPRAHSSRAAELFATASLSVERRGFAGVCCLRERALGGSACFTELSPAEVSGGDQAQQSSLSETLFEGPKNAAPVGRSTRTPLGSSLS
jgi:hypothetical protein